MANTNTNTGKPAATPAAPEATAKEEPKTGDTGEAEAKKAEAVAEDAESEGDIATYYLRSGMAHTVIVKGEFDRKTQEGDAVELTRQQYASFKDKFYTAAQWKAIQVDRAEAATDGDIEAGE